MNSFPFLVGALCVLAIGYRYYSAFLAAKVVSLDATRVTPAYRLNDGANYQPTSRWVVFGHHFAAITGAGPLIGPVLAAQFGFLPGFLWILIGVVLGGAVQDFIILFASTRRDGKSLALIARDELGPVAGLIVAIVILFVIVVALAGLGLAVVNALKESSWGVFTIACSVPLGLLMGLYMFKLKPGQILGPTLVGVLAMLGAVVGGGFVPGSWLAPYLTLTSTQVTIAIAVYGFVASVLPMWLLLCPRDYLSSYMKLGTIGLLILGLLIVRPELHIPPLTAFIHGGGPIIPGKVFPYIFITIACGAISGFHSLVASGTTSKMISNEMDIRPIGYGAMLLEGLVGITALLACSALYPGDYFAINVSAEKFARLGFQTVHLSSLAAVVGENVAGRTGGAVSLAVGMAQVFTALPGMKMFMSYWYHFAIMFEALFILTTIDAGTRVGRFVLQELLGHVWKPLERPDHWLGNLLATTLVVGAWSYFIFTGSISTIWPMFGVANQLLSVIALCIGTTVLMSMGRKQYAWVTFVPMVVVSVTTLTAAWQNITHNFLPLAHQAGHGFQGGLNAGLTVMMMACTVFILATGIKRWLRYL